MINGKIIEANCIKANKGHFENSILLRYDKAEPHYRKVPFSALSKTELSGNIVGNFLDEKKNRQLLLGDKSHTLVVGGTGSGKTEGYFIPQIDLVSRSKNAPSMFIMDVKGTIYRRTAKVLEENGYKVFVLNFKEPFSSARFNPLSSIYNAYRKAKRLEKRLEKDGVGKTFEGKAFKTHEECVAYVKREILLLLDKCQTELKNVATIMCPIESTKDPSWDYGSRDAIFYILWGMLEDSDYPDRGMTIDKYTIYNLSNIAYTVENDCEYINAWTGARDATSDTRKLGAYYNLRAKQTRDSYVSCINNKLNRYVNLPVQVITAASDLDIDEIVMATEKEKVAIFCMTDESRTITYDLCMLFISQLLGALQRHADLNGEAKNDFNFYLDEFANMPCLPNMEKWISTLRSRRVWLHMGIQSYEQLAKNYDNQVREIIMDNCDTQIFFGCNNKQTVEVFSQSLGQKCGAVTGFGLNNNGDMSVNISPTNLPLVTKSDLSMLEAGKAYVKCFRKPPLYTALDYHFSYSDLVKANCVPPVVTQNLTDIQSNFYDIKAIVKKLSRRSTGLFDF